MEPALGTIYRTAWTFCVSIAGLRLLDEPARDPVEDGGVGAGAADPVCVRGDQVDVWADDSEENFRCDYGVAEPFAGWVGAGVWVFGNT